MPLTFQPQNRRDFCRNVLGGTLAAAFWTASEKSRAEESPRDHWVFLSDTHIPGNPNEGRHGYNPNKNFADTREAVLQLGNKPQGVIVTGDFAFLQGKPEDYRQIAAQVAPYTENGIPVHVSLGNHDNIDNFYAAFTDLKKESSPVVNKHIAVLETPNVNLFLLDSLYLPDAVSGLLGLEQLRWLKKELNARKDKPALLFAHHNLDSKAGMLMDREEFWNVVKPAKQVKAYIYGHTHIYQQEVRDGVHLINLPALGWEFQSGKQPLGWSDAEISGNGIRLTLHTLPPNHPKNGDVRNFEWLR
ncbi:MAG: metallophosphoesterase [Planctomycetaceae bacterium]|nr:metallophosphoesterase [Planctomycetaceae bacterium]